MPHIDEVKILRKRAKAFLKTAETPYQDGEYDLTVYLREQAIQLHLKSILLEELGDYPRTHSLTYLFQLLQKNSGAQKPLQYIQGQQATCHIPGRRLHS